jgi:hypothetical protein
VKQIQLHRFMTKFNRILYWAGPSLLCLLLYWHGLTAWFQLDDFAWLALSGRVHDFQSFLVASFTPYAQGTIRPISERWFFMGFFSLFGMDALPFRITVFATQFVNLALLAMIMRRLTGSALAGFAAPVLWVCNANIYWPLTWTSAYNQILCSTVILLAFYLFLRFTETGARKYYVWQWVVFVLGFGVLEVVVLYPAIAALYAAIRARRYLLHTVPMFAVSAGYTVLNRSVQRPVSTEVYKMFFDKSMLKTFVTYCQFALGPQGIVAEVWPSRFIGYAVCGILAAALIAFSIIRVRKGDMLPVFFLGWFTILVGPYIPLRNHVSDYYLTIPTIGLSMLGAYAIVRLRGARPRLRAISGLLVLLYAIPSAIGGYLSTTHHYHDSKRVQNFIEPLAYAHKRNPGKDLLIHGVDDPLFWSGFYDQPYRIFGIPKVYLTPETESAIGSFPERPISHYFMSELIAYEGIRSGKIAVYEVYGERLRNVTQLYGAMLDAKVSLKFPRVIDTGVPLYSVLLPEGWYAPEDGHRWMSKRATAEIAAPENEGASLTISGTCPDAHFQHGPLMLTVSVDGYTFPASKIDSSNTQFTFSYPLPAGSSAKRKLNVALEVDRTVRLPPDERDLGVSIRLLEVSR